MSSISSQRLILLLVILIIAIILIQLSKYTPVKIVKAEGRKHLCSCSFCECNPSLDDVCFQIPQEDSLPYVLDFANKQKPKLLSGSCSNNTYTPQTLNPTLKRILTIYTNLALKELNHRSNIYNTYLNKPNSKPLHFILIDISNATSSVDKNGNSRWKVDIQTQELQLQFGQRLLLDFTIEFYSNKQSNSNIPRFPFGYPLPEQLIPLPIDVIPTGNEILSENSIDPDIPKLKHLWLNSATLKNSNLVLGSLKPTTFTLPSPNNSNLESSPYTEENNININFEKTEDISDNDIYKNSVERGSVCNGRGDYNKWIGVLGEPSDRYEYPWILLGETWNRLGLMDSRGGGISSATKREDIVPLNLPTNTGLPINGGSYNWLFGNLESGQMTDASTRP